LIREKLRLILTYLINYFEAFSSIIKLLCIYKLIIFKAPSLEAIISNLEKDGSDWAKQQIKILGQMSPTALKIAFKQFQLGARKNLKECLDMEYKLMLPVFCHYTDLAEGIRALIIDRDNNPKWRPDSIDKVDEQLIDSYIHSNEEKLILPD
jgi:hypothetical protein